MIYLLHQIEGDIYYIVHSNEDYPVSVPFDNCNFVVHTEILEKAIAITELLHKLQNTGDMRWYVVLDYANSNGKYRHEEYPQHQSLGKLAGYISDVCDIRKKKTSYTAEYEINFVSELWVKSNDNKISKVAYFEENMKQELEVYLQSHQFKKE